MSEISVIQKNVFFVCADKEREKKEGRIMKLHWLN